MNNAIPFSPSRLDATFYLKRRLKNYLAKSQNLIDIGCGRLFFLNLLKESNFRGNYFGIDTNPVTPSDLPDSFKAKITRVSIANLKTREKFDVVVCLWVLEHIKNDELALKKINQLLTTHGMFIVAVPSTWSWPFEFGRHGYHYYSRDSIIELVEKAGFEIINYYNAAGLLGFIFMLAYNWPRFLILIAIFPIFKLATMTGFKKASWENFSRTIISNTVYLYHRSKIGLKVHNSIVSFINKIDNNFKILPSSYVIISRKI